MNQCESAEDDTGEGLLLGGGIFGDNPVLGPNEEHLPSKPETSASRLAEVARAVREGHTKAVTVRQLLLWFGASRRGSRVVDAIRSSLDHAQLVTEPDFEGAFIDSNVRFELRSNAEARSNATESSGNVPPGEPTAASVSK